MDISAMIGRKIADYRAKEDISQKSFAHDCGISSRYLSRLENGKANPSLKVLEHVSAQMQITLTDLLRY